MIYDGKIKYVSIERYERRPGTRVIFWRFKDGIRYQSSMRKVTRKNFLLLQRVLERIEKNVVGEFFTPEIVRFTYRIGE